jgi:hypothetical protein
MFDASFGVVTEGMAQQLFIRFLWCMSALFLLAGCSLHEYTKDETYRRESAPAVGHCFQLRIDVHVMFRKQSEINDGGKVLLQSDGYIEPWPGRKELERTGTPIYPKGTHFTVERVLGRYYPQVGMFLKPFARFIGGDELIEVSSLFRTTSSDEPLEPVEPFIEVCE